MEGKVYGTEFNMNTYQHGVVQTVLVSGKVGIRVNATGKEVMFIKHVTRLVVIRSFPAPSPLKSLPPSLFTTTNRL